VLAESMTLLQDIDNEDFRGNLSFDLSIVNQKEYNEEFLDVLNFHLKLLNTFVDNLNV